MTRRVRWLGDQSRFVRVDGGGWPTGDYVDGNDARLLQAMLDEKRLYPILTSHGDEMIEAGKSLPLTWERDWAWEDAKRITTQRGTLPPEEKFGRRYGGRRHVRTAYENSGVCPRSVRIRDFDQLLVREWWSTTYPSIPFRLPSKDYHWMVPVIDVEDCDVEVLILATTDHHGIPEFADVTDEESGLASSAVQAAH